jgi:hypothetical protein
MLLSMLISDVLADVYRICQTANTSDVSRENKTHIYQAANTPDISIKNKIRICQAAITSYILFSILISDVLATW